MTITIHPVTTIEQCRQVETLQETIWQANPLDIVPDHLILTMAKEGGLVLLALNEHGLPVGFAMGFLGVTQTGQLKLASHQVGVLPAYQNQHVGYQLKLAQREIALARQIPLMTWTYDPLRATNAYFNLHKLGAVCCTYNPNLYGFMRDGLNQAMPSDRFRVDWWLESDHVSRCLAGQPQPVPLTCPVLNPVTQFIDNLPQPCDQVLPLTEAAGLVEFPPDIQSLKTQNLALACQWQTHLAQIWQAAFAAGYTAIDVVRRAGRIYYLLQYDWQPAKMGAIV